MNLPKVVWIPAIALATLVVLILNYEPQYDHSIAREAAACANLKSGVFPAEILFQAEGVLDQNHNGVGEYGCLSEVSGRREVGSHARGEIRYLAGPFAKGDMTSGYRFAVYLPDGKGGALAEPKEPGVRLVGSLDAAKDQEQHFVAYAWPIEASSGKNMFAITESGVVRGTTWVRQAPTWNAVFGGQGWDAPPVWPLYPR